MRPQIRSTKGECWSLHRGMERLLSTITAFPMCWPRARELGDSILKAKPDAASDQFTTAAREHAFTRSYLRSYRCFAH